MSIQQFGGAMVAGVQAASWAAAGLMAVVTESMTTVLIWLGGTAGMCVYQWLRARTATAEKSNEIAWLKERLARTERRVEHLEQENRRLYSKLADLGHVSQAGEEEAGRN